MPDDVPIETGLADSRAVMSEVWDRLDAASAPAEPTAAPDARVAVDAAPGAPAPEAPADGPARGPDGKFVKKEAGEAVRGTPPARPPDSGAQDGAASGAQAGPPPGQAAPAAPPVPVIEPLKAPQSWKPAAREKWAAVPPEVQAEALRRETEISKALNETAEPRKLKEVVAPYEHLFRAAGVGAPQAIGNLLQRYAALTTAPQHVRADILGQLVRENLGTDEAAITALADAIERKGSIGAPAIDQTQVQAMIRQQLDQERRVAQRTSAESMLQQFEATQPEYLNDVREDMGDLLGSWERRNPGAPVTLEVFQQAYQKACLLNDDVRTITQQKEAAKAAEKVNASTQRAKAASVSVRSQPGGPAAPPALGDDTRSHIAAAWDRAAQ